MADYYRFRVQLQHIEPPIWRRFILPVTASFADLHGAIQDCGGWGDYHLYTFLAGGERHGEVPAASGSGADAAWSSTPLASWFGERGQAARSCIYWYDFGDDWLHAVELEGLEKHAEDHGRRLLGGARSFPREDCGGVPGYERCVRVWRNGQFPRSTDEDEEPDDEDVALLDWLGDWEPDRFDLEEEQLGFDSPTAGPPPSTGAGTPRVRASYHDDWAEDSTSTEVVPGPAANLARHLRMIVRAASLHPVGEPITTGIACMRRPQRRKCRGTMIATLNDPPGAVEYQCSACKDSGFIFGWEGSSHDLRTLAASAPQGEKDQIAVRLPADVYGALLDDRNLAIQSDRLLYSALASAGQVQLRGTFDEVEDLYEATCAEANHAPPGVLLKRLEAACDLLRAALA